MAAFLQSIDLASGVNAGLYSSAPGYDTTANIRIVNRNSSTITVSIAIVAATDAASAIAALTNANYIEYNAPVSANDILENSGLAIPPGHTILVRSNNSGVNAVVYGYSQSA